MSINKELEMLRACTTEDERAVLVEQLKKQHADDSEETSLNNLREIKNRLEALKVEAKLLEVQKLGISLTYISKRYLAKSRSYLSQRLHGNMINGKSVLLSKDEIKKISKGLEELSNELRVLSTSLIS